MSDTQRSDVRAVGETDAAAGIDRDAKIEQLLLQGLDFYFASQYEQAVNVWTRALFLDRNHPRAHAYIERARSALAERERQSEELLHDGVAAFHRGDGDEARRLLEAAIAKGAPSDEALPVLERLNRPVAAASPIRRDMAAASAKASPLRGHRTAVEMSGRRGMTFVAIPLSGLIALVVYIGSVNRGDWRLLFPFLSDTEPTAGAAAAPIPQDLSLPLPRRGEMMLARGRLLAANGRLHEALAVLAQIRIDDPQKDEVDRLRGEIQRQLLALTSMPPSPAPPDRRQP